eukprot:g15445.t1
MAEQFVVIKYVNYAEQFALTDGKLTQADIDDLYCISAVMPNSCMHLGEREFVGAEEHEYLPQEPKGTWCCLTSGNTMTGPGGLRFNACRRGLQSSGRLTHLPPGPTINTYWLYVQEDAKQYEEDMKKAKQTWAGVAADKQASTKEGCSCLYGSPCIDPDNCTDWDNR